MLNMGIMGSSGEHHIIMFKNRKKLILGKFLKYKNTNNFMFSQSAYFIYKKQKEKTKFQLKTKHY